MKPRPLNVRMFLVEFMRLDAKESIQNVSKVQAIKEFLIDVLRIALKGFSFAFSLNFKF